MLFVLIAERGAGEWINIFFRTYSLYINRLKYKGEVINEEEDLSQNEEFCGIFEKQYFETTKKIKYKYNTTFQNLFFIKDSPRELNWRKKIYEQYKENRKDTKYKNKTFNLSLMFKKVYADILPKIQLKFKINILKIENAEADDVISVIVREIPHYVDTYIISADTDYLQLLTRKNVYIYNLNGRFINDKLNGKTAEEKLLEKIVCGDKTDNIPPCLPNMKLIRWLLDKPEYLINMLNINTDIKNIFDRNRMLIDFGCIPETIKKSILSAFYECMR